MSNPPSASLLGLDLAWSTRNPTGACALDSAGRVVDERMLESDDEIIDWVARHLAERAVVAIDAPLQVPNETGRRPCENELHREYGSRRAGPHASNRSRLVATHGAIRGEDLAARLADLDFGGPWAGRDRTVLEVYPHPAIIETFELPERLVYKAKRGVSVDRRRQGLRKLARLVDSLATASPPFVAPTISIGEDVKGAALKLIEDRLDARLCAWIAAVWNAAPERMRLFGDAATGHIAVPIGRPPSSRNPDGSEIVVHHNLPGD